jgi:hypothetical protein
LTVAQISEFSIIFVAMGVSLGQVDASALGLVTLVGLVTITTSTYMILYSHRLYTACEPWLGRFERNDPFRERALESPLAACDVIVFGMGRYGRRVAERLHAEGFRVLGVDFDPGLQAQRNAGGIPVVFGDAADDEFVGDLPLAGVKAIVSTLKDIDTDVGLLSSLRRCGYEGTITATAHHAGTGHRLVAAGADEVLMPYRDAADNAARRISLSIQRGKRP